MVLIDTIGWKLLRQLMPTFQQIQRNFKILILHTTVPDRTISKIIDVNRKRRKPASFKSACCSRLPQVSLSLIRLFFRDLTTFLKSAIDISNYRSCSFKRFHLFSAAACRFIYNSLNAENLSIRKKSFRSQNFTNCFHQHFLWIQRKICQIHATKSGVLNSCMSCLSQFFLYWIRCVWQTAMWVMEKNIIKCNPHRGGKNYLIKYLWYLRTQTPARKLWSAKKFVLRRKRKKQICFQASKFRGRENRKSFLYLKRCVNTYDASTGTRIFYVSISIWLSLLYLSSSSRALPHLPWQMMIRWNFCLQHNGTFCQSYSTSTHASLKT